MSIHRAYAFSPNTEKLKLLTFWENDVDDERVEIACMRQKLLGFQIVTEYNTENKVFDDTVMKQPVVIGDLDFSEGCSSQLVEHVYKDDAYYWSEGNAYDTLDEIVESIKIQMETKYSGLKVVFDDESMKIFEQEKNIVEKQE
jgi:hypothetical protein